MRVFPFSVVLAAVAAVTVGCASPTATHGAGGSPAAAPRPSVAASSPSTPAQPADPVDESEPMDDVDLKNLVMSADGVGPYKIGARVEELRKSGLLGELDPVDAKRCPELYYAAAGGKYEGTFLLVIRHQVLVQLGTGPDVRVRIPDGTAATAGSWREVRRIYGKRGAMIKDSEGKQGFLARDGDRVMLFSGHPIRPGIGYITVGMADYVEHVFRTGKSC